MSSQDEVTPEEFRRLWAERKRLLEQRAEKLAALDAEIEQVDRELNQDPVPPGLDAAAKVTSAIREFSGALTRHIEHVEHHIETPFRRTWAPTPEVLDAIEIVSMELGDVLEGIRPPEALLRAAAAIVDEGIVQARQALAVGRCAETLEAWHALPQGRLDEAAASEKLDFYSRALIDALVEIEPGFRKLEVATVAKTIREARSNASPVTLLVELSKAARVWPGATRKRVWRAVENHSEKVST